MPHLSRRDFLAASVLAAGALGRARADEPKAGANDTIALGFIGVGGMGTGLLNIFQKFPDVRVAAVCDIYEPHRLRAKEAAGGKPDDYKDFRHVLDRKDIDAVVIATPDHWHAIPTLLACQAEKDIYCEKPLTYSIAEGRAVVNAAEKYHRVTQMGNLIHAGETYHRIAEIVQSGVLGQITKVRVWMAGNHPGLGSPEDSEPPAGCDYDFWLGPAPKRPFNPNRFTFNWRYFWDYAGGQLTDFVCHLVDPVHWGMRVDAPETITATGGRYALKDNAETPDTLEVVYHYPTGFDMVWSHINNNAHGFEGRSAGIEFQGTNATLHGHYNDFKILPEKDREEIPLPEPFLPRSVGHHREWLDAIKTRARCSCHFEYGHRLTTVGNLGNIALWTGEKLRWDPEAERITNHPEANQHLERAEYRSPWTLPKV
ncbi:MAG: Gfo/Idh/MocA family oxidoreductase [Isosphaeraceae bacterium]|nr:Gfo/Idh/MocA family oxidoreductase [Isosphaeraceae bacterium]